MAQSLESDQQQPPAKAPPPETSLFSRSGFMDGLKGIGHKASDLAGKAAQKGHELATSETGQKIKTQAVETTHQVMASPITQRVVSSAERNGKQEFNETASNAQQAIAAGKRGDILGAARHAAPVVLEVAAPMKVVTGTALNIAADQLPASQRGTARHITDAAHVLNGHGLTNLTITGLARAGESQATQELKHKAVQTVLESTQHQQPAATHRQAEIPMQTASAPVSSTADFVQALKKKIAAKAAGSN